MYSPSLPSLITTHRGKSARRVEVLLTRRQWTHRIERRRTGQKKESILLTLITTHRFHRGKGSKESPLRVINSPKDTHHNATLRLLALLLHYWG
ncbi:hypothetical protein Pelo_7023 [Pelomyxa schiedti]|nr:hypothetical protein Pelo_7023 [Pelomyxa schiedti]